MCWRGFTLIEGNWTMLQIWNDAERIAEYKERSPHAEDHTHAERIRQDIRLMEAGETARRRLERLIEDNRRDGVIA